jgi:hypothetical protein
MGNGMFRSVADLNVNYFGGWYFLFEVSYFVFWQIGVHATHGAFIPPFVRRCVQHYLD